MKTYAELFIERILEECSKMKFPKVKKKSKFSRCCYNCKHNNSDCPNRFKVNVCEKFKFSATCKSI